MLRSWLHALCMTQGRMQISWELLGWGVLQLRMSVTSWEKTAVLETQLLLSPPVGWAPPRQCYSSCRLLQMPRMADGGSVTWGPHCIKTQVIKTSGTTWGGRWFPPQVLWASTSIHRESLTNMDFYFISKKKFFLGALQWFEQVHRQIT